MASEYETNHPIIFSLTAAMIFLFTALVFFAYDVMVERRQKSVMQTAVHSSAIVSSLFPSSVRDQLYPVSQETAQNNDGFFKGAPLDGEMNFSGSAIAQAYPETTVLFADIAGFTAWSSSRQPIQVFQLLETVYAAFDKLAKQHGVFKVETIGDCYVAVVGLPTPRRSHAVVMARFARDIRNKMQELAPQLETNLGQVGDLKETYAGTMSYAMYSLDLACCILQGTADLALRIGLNSGSTTAGVLRGEKSRFQLFGDVSYAKAPLLHSWACFTAHLVSVGFHRRSTLLLEWKVMVNAIGFTCQRRLRSSFSKPVMGTC
jgi:Adenylate and Guanylate cyclase catalytic domain